MPDLSLTKARHHAPDGSSPAVVLDGVGQRLGGVWALRGVSLVAHPGELIAVTGHNGSGKTTLLRVIATLLRPTRGEGRVYGHDLKGDPDAVRAVTALLTHATGLYDDLTAGENLEFALRMTGAPVDRRVIAEALARVGVGGAVDQRVRTFSSGMRRRTAIARLLLRPARLVLLDEPYNSLDGDGVAVVDELLASVRAQGGTALVVLHDLERGCAAFDRVVELRSGRLAGTRTGATSAPLSAVGARR